MAAAPDQVATSLDQPTQIEFRLDKVPNGSYQAPRYSQSINIQNSSIKAVYHIFLL